MTDSLQKEYKPGEVTEGALFYQIICIVFGEWNN